MATPIAVFPGAVATDGQLQVANNLIQSTLMVAINQTATTIYVASAAGFRANSLVSIDTEIIFITAVSLSPAALTVGTRGFDGTTAASHNTGAKVSMFIDAWHHNALASEVKAIEQWLGPNGSNLPNQPFLGNGLYPAGSFVFSPQTPGGSLIVGSNVITLTPVPQGVNGSDAYHYLCISGGTGQMEAVLITGGTAVSGAASGTVIVNCTYAHSGAFTIGTATAGIQEAYQHIKDTTGAGTIMIPNKENDICGQISISIPNIVIRGVGWGSIIKAEPNAGLTNGLIHVYSAATGFGIYNLTLDGNSQNGGTGSTSVTCCLFLGAGHARVVDCCIQYSNRSGIFYGDTSVTVTDVLISGCLITGNGGRSGWAPGQNSGYFGMGVFGGGAATPNDIRIIGNRFTDNHNFDTGPGDGCAINLTSTQVAIIGNYFENNFNMGGGQVYLVNYDASSHTLPVFGVINGNEIWCTGRFGSPQDYTAGIECYASYVTIAGNNIHDLPAHGILIDGDQTTSVTVTGNTIRNTEFGIGINPSNGTKSVSHVLINGNTVRNAGQYGVALYNVHDYIFVRNNELESATQAIAGLSSGHDEFTDNFNTPGQAPTHVTMTASPMAYTSSGYKEVVSIMGATTLSVMLQGVAIAANSGSWTYSLNANSSIVITYTGSPTMTVSYLD